MACVCFGMELRFRVEVETLGPTRRRGRACMRYISKGARYVIEEKCVQISGAGCHVCNRVLALQPEHRKSLQLAKVREATGCLIFIQSQFRIHRGFEPTTDLGTGITRLGDTTRILIGRNCTLYLRVEEKFINNGVEFGHSHLADD